MPSRLPPIPRAAVPFIRAINEMLSNALSEFVDDGLERVEHGILKPAVERVSRARGVAQKHKRKPRS
jgi:hypothetical protein